MVPVEGHDADGAPLLVDFDEVVRPDANLADLGKLKPAFNPKGSVTAGNSSAISDGASCTLIMSADTAKALGIKPLARIVSMASAGRNPRSEERRVGKESVRMCRSRRASESSKRKINRIEIYTTHIQNT